MVTAGIFPFKENSHGRAGNRTRDLMISSQRLWPLEHEAGQLLQSCQSDYCAFLKKMHLICPAWVESLNIYDSGRGGGKTYSCRQKHKPLLLHDLFPVIVVCVLSIYNKPDVKYLHSFNYIERYIK